MLILIIISFIILLFISSHYIKLSALTVNIIFIIILIIVNIVFFPILFADLYEMKDSAVLYPSVENNADFTVIKREGIHFIERVQQGKYRYTGLSNGFKRGFIKSEDIKGRLSNRKEFAMKLLLTIPSLMIYLLLLSIGLISYDLKRIKGFIPLRERMYIDSAVIREIKSLRTELEEMRVRKNRLERIKNRIEELREMTLNDEIIKQLDELSQERKELYKESGFTNFRNRLNRCTNFAQEGLLRLDFEDYEGAVRIVKEGFYEYFSKRFETELSHRELIDYLHKAKVIDYDMRIDLNWLNNLRGDLNKKENKQYIDETRLRKIFANMDRLLEDNK
ncbi:MAG: hypothetical protein SVK54_03925 [candidate division WOR-3 bacterium]|nr:hypothetical protein [candidate division WOR-3 bacterium]